MYYSDKHIKHIDYSSVNCIFTGQILSESVYIELFLNGLHGNPLVINQSLIDCQLVIKH
jgi:hypothetical protein